MILLTAAVISGVTPGAKADSTALVAASLGLHASFLAKTQPGQEGSSGHVHLSCWADDANAFGQGVACSVFARKRHERRIDLD